MRGYTLIELLIVSGISIVILSVGALGLLNYRASQDLRLAAQSVASTLRDARSNATTGEDGLRWGVRFVGGVRGSATLFSTDGTSYLASATMTLKSDLEFRDPATGSTKDVIFDRLTGYPIGGTAVIIEIGVIGNDAVSTTLNIYANGRIEF
ncbi:MAG: hypothetical protein Q7R85_04010 [bacterium]|nr:hypothetical protein [bacterium]